MVLIAANAFSGQKLCKATFNDIEVLRQFLPPQILQLKLLTLQILTATFSSTLHFFTSIKNTLAHTKVTPKFKALDGLMPMVMWVLIHWFMFKWSDWAWLNPGYVIIMTFPVISLINSRQIVCNVTKMKMDVIPKVTLWYLAFPINRIVPSYYPEFSQLVS